MGVESIELRMWSTSVTFPFKQSRLPFQGVTIQINLKSASEGKTVGRVSTIYVQSTGTLRLPSVRNQWRMVNSLLQPNLVHHDTKLSNITRHILDNRTGLVSSQHNCFINRFFFSFKGHQQIMIYHTLKLKARELEGQTAKHQSQSAAQNGRSIPTQLCFKNRIKNPSLSNSFTWKQVFSALRTGREVQFQQQTAKFAAKMCIIFKCVPRSAERDCP